MSKNDQLLKDLQDVADALSADGYRYPADFVDFAITELRRLEKIEAKYNAIMAQEPISNETKYLLLAGKVRDALHLANYLMQPTANENDAAAYIEARNSVLKSLNKPD